MPLNSVIALAQSELDKSHGLLNNYLSGPKNKPASDVVCLTEAHLKKHLLGATDAMECWFFTIRIRRFLLISTGILLSNQNQCEDIRRLTLPFLRKFPHIDESLRSIFLSTEKGLNALIVGLLIQPRAKFLLQKWCSNIKELPDPLKLLYQFFSPNKANKDLKAWQYYHTINQPTPTPLTESVDEIITDYPLVIKKIFEINYSIRTIEDIGHASKQDELASKLVSLTNQIIDLKNILATGDIAIIDTESVFEMLVSLLANYEQLPESERLQFSKASWSTLWSEFSTLLLTREEFTKPEISTLYHIYDNVTFALSDLEHCLKIYFLFSSHLLKHKLYDEASYVTDSTLHARYIKTEHIPDKHAQYLALLILFSRLCNWIDQNTEKVNLNESQLKLIRQHLYKKSAYHNNTSLKLIAETLIKYLISHYRETNPEKQKLCQQYFEMFAGLFPSKKQRNYRQLFKQTFGISAFGIFQPPDDQVNISTPSSQQLITIPQCLVNLIAQLKDKLPGLHCYLTGASVSELWLKDTPNDYDMILFGVDESDFLVTLKQCAIPFHSMSKNRALYSLSIQEIDIDFNLIPSEAGKKIVSRTLKADYSTRDFTVCSLYAEVTGKCCEIPVTGFQKSEKHLFHKTVKTITPPGFCFNQDPIRYFRLVKWQLKHPDFDLSDSLKIYLTNQTIDFYSVFSLHNKQDYRFKGRLRTVLEQMYARFPSNDLFNHPLFCDVLCGCFKLENKQWLQLQELVIPLEGKISSISPCLITLLTAYQLSLYQNNTSNICQLVYLNSTEYQLFRYVFELYQEQHSYIFLGDRTLAEVLESQASLFSRISHSPHSPISISPKSE